MSPKAVTEPAAEPVPAVRAELFGPGRRATTVGLVLLTFVTAFEAMGVGTAMPAVIDDLGAVSAYAWPFAAFLAASVLGTVLGGRWCDVAGPRAALVVSPLVFAVGLLAAGTASTLAQLLVGRVLQGASAGAQFVAVFVTIAAVYPERARPAVFGLMSSAWVLPSLVGPPLAGFVTDRFSWHWVFLGLVPVVGVALALVVPAVRRLGRRTTGTTRTNRARATPRAVIAAAAGAALGVSALSAAAQRPTLLGAVVAVAAVAVLVPSLRRLLPRGVFRARRGVPAVVAARGLIAGVFFTANAYLPLMLTATHGWSLTAAGVPLVTASLGWASASAWQGRHPDLSRTTLLRAGFALLATGLAGLLLVAPPWGWAWLALPGWTVAGLGMGIGFSAVSFLLLHHSPEGEVGADTAAAQLADQLTTAALIGLGGALLALLATPATALTVLLVPLTALAVLGALLAAPTATAA
ncbi:MAG: major facilitator superfamily 1 [Pseudonocardia sp.]|jgi:MFS family permease|nr:major facilitator superfamily 1 [Pseudonocardia sp.]